MTVLESAERFEATTRSRRARRARRWIAAAVVVVLAAAAIWVVWFSPLLAVREVRVLGVRSVSVDSVRQAAAVPVGQPLARVDVPGIAERVGAIPEVAAVEVRRGWPDVLVVVVTERVPVAVAAATRGFSYVDATGARFGSVVAAPRGMPVVGSANEDALRSAAAVVAALPEPLRATVRTVAARTYDDIVLTLAGGATVRWGSVDESARKATVLRALLSVTATSYDVSAPDLPTTRGRVTASATP
jgi:cell division protein FtsQ